MGTKLLVLMVGLPRSGKTTKAMEYARKHNAAIVNPDSIRLALHGQAYVQSAEAHVWAIAHTMVDSLFMAGHDIVVIDACNNTQKRRNEWRYGKWDERCFIEVRTDAETCLDRLSTTDANYENLKAAIERMDKQHEAVAHEEGSLIEF